jgi:N6-adenosine-specific RNA methylase IME4
MQRELSLTELSRRDELEQVIELGLGTFIQVGSALAEMRDARLYRNTHTTFEDYCKERWNMSRFYAHRLMDSAEVATNLLPIGNIQPANEAQVRPLTGLEPEQQREVWLEAVETAPNGKVTAAHVEAIKTEILAKAREIRLERWEEMKARKSALAAELNSKPIPLPGGRFGVIAIDPPWRYDMRIENSTHRVTCRYPDMNVEEIAALQVPAAEDCVLWLWTTNAFMAEAHVIAAGWGFDVKTILTWVKDKFGCGAWLRGKSEHCLMCARGRPLVTLSNQTTVLFAPSREHGRKPDEFFALVDSLCPGAKLEMFARQPRLGWQVWGAETNEFV